MQPDSRIVALSSHLPARIWIIGHPGSGKTTLGTQLAALTRSPMLELDALRWGSNWTDRCAAAIHGDVAQFVAENDRWIVDGMYSQCADILLRHADLVLFLDLPLPRLFHNVLSRSLGRILRRTELWHGNRETLGRLFGPQSMLAYVIGSYREKLAEAQGYLRSAEMLGASAITLGGSGECKRLVDALRERPA